MKASSKSKINKFNNDLGFKNVNIELSNDKESLIINKDSYSFRNIYNIEVKKVIHDKVRIIVDEEDNYNVFKGYLGYEILDDPIGLLNGIEVETTYEDIYSYRIELILTLRNKIKTYCLGIYMENDDQCIEHYEAVDKFCGEARKYLVHKTNKTNIFTNILKLNKNVFLGIFYVLFIILKYALYISLGFFILIISVIFKCAKRS